MTSATLDAALLSHDEPAGIAPRGTLVLLTGRGEPASVYGRFARRIASDAYRVRVVETRLGDLDRTRRELAALLEDPELPAPHVLAGSDAGAAVAASLAGELGVDAFVLAGLPLPDGDGPSPEDAWEDELELRTACPAHRRVLSEDPELRRGRLADPLPARLTGRVPPPAVPTLVLHGSDDAVAPAAVVLEGLAGADGVRTVLVEGGRHDVLNDVTHRSVAAILVLFLERLRLGVDAPPVVRDVDAV